MVNKKKNKKKESNFLIPEVPPIISRTGDVKTNDFNLTGEKIPPLSTIRTQLKNVHSLIETSITAPARIEFDRLRIALNLERYGELVGFVEWGMENVQNPTAPPSYMEDIELRAENPEPRIFNPFLEEDTNEYDVSDLPDIEGDEDSFTSLSQEEAENVVEAEDEVSDEEIDVIHDKKVKRRIRYEDYRAAIGLINMFICRGYFVADVSGKWMADTGVLGSLHRDKIGRAHV